MSSVAFVFSLVFVTSRSHILHSLLAAGISAFGTGELWVLLAGVYLRAAERHQPHLPQRRAPAKPSDAGRRHGRPRSRSRGPGVPAAHCAPV
ncbi:hypothetical protein E4631_01000 [Hymenobacter sp. UV11]|nr:hypothetical protein E4631_01000 [Hymenobacter sp. UV11]